MARAMTKIGDIFSVRTDQLTVKFFQYVGNDLTQLSTDVIRVFNARYDINLTHDLSKVIKTDIEFYAHCVIKWGIRRNLWQKVGYSEEIGEVDIYFRGTNDYGRKIGDESIKKSENWYVWKINDEKFTGIGILEKKFQNADIGLLVNPDDIVNRMKFGQYSFEYPGY